MKRTIFTTLTAVILTGMFSLTAHVARAGSVTVWNDAHGLRLIVRDYRKSESDIREERRSRGPFIRGYIPSAKRDEPGRERFSELHQNVRKKFETFEHLNRDRWSQYDPVKQTITVVPDWAGYFGTEFEIPNDDKHYTIAVYGNAISGFQYHVFESEG